MPRNNQEFAPDQQFIRVDDEVNFANAFKTAIENQVKVRDAISNLILCAIRSNSETRKELSKLICESLKGESAAWWHKFGGAVFTVIIAIISAAVGAIITALVK